MLERSSGSQLNHFGGDDFKREGRQAVDGSSVVSQWQQLLRGNARMEDGAGVRLKRGGYLMHSHD